MLITISVWVWCKNIVSLKTCFKCKDNPSCIDLFITNSPNSFLLSFINTSTITTGLSNSHNIVITVLKATFTKRVFPIEILNCSKEKIKSDLKNSLRIKNISSYHVLKKIFLKVLGRYATIKNKTSRANHAPYVTKTMRNEKQ